MTRFIIRPCIEAGGEIVEAVAEAPEFWGVYERDADGLSMHRIDHPTRAEAEAWVAAQEINHAE